MCSSSPDTSGINAAAVANAGIAKDALDWYKKAYADQAPLRDAAAARSNAVSDAQLRAMNTATDEAQRAGDYRRSVYEPLERGIVSDATNFNTEAEREKLAGKALGDVNEQFANARETGVRELTRRGVNPSDGGYGAVAGQLALGQALAGADAATKSRQQSITLGRALKMDAASLGRNLPGNQATQASLALNAGNASAGNAQTPVSLAQAGTQQVGQGFNTAIQGNQSSGNLYGQAAQLSNTNNDGLFSALGNVAGRVGAAYITSDKNQKTDRKPVKGEVALSAARKMPVETWKYKRGTPADDGGKTHAGPMAQKVRLALGDAVAPGGKMVDVNSMTAMTLAAVKALDQKVTRLEKRKA